MFCGKLCTQTTRLQLVILNTLDITVFLQGYFLQIFPDALTKWERERSARN